MLGRLFSSAASSLNHNSAHPSTSSKKSSPESVQEEIYTRSLLFPDASLLNQPQSHIFPLPTGSSSVVPAPPTGYDCYGELDLESPRDVRIIVAQDDATTQLEKVVLYDSKPVASPQVRPFEPPPPPRLPWQPEDESCSPSPLRPRSSGGVAAEPAVGRRRGVPTPLNTSPTLSNPPTSPYQRPARRPSNSAQSKYLAQQRNELRTFLDCMFGSTPLAYKGPSTKLHVMPAEARPDSRTGQSTPFGDHHDSFGRAEGRKRSQLGQSFVPPSPNPSTRESPSPPKRKTILITRMFSVLMPNSTSNVSSSTSNKAEGDRNYPSSGARGYHGEHRLVKQVKTPMFAVSIIITLPVTRPAAKSGSSSYTGPRMASSFHESSPHSFDTNKHMSALDAFFGSDALSISTVGDAEDGMDTITQHWDVITRILSSLQTVVQAEIFRQLSSIEINPSPNPLKQLSGNAAQYRKPQKASIQLSSGALMSSEVVGKAAEFTGKRIVQALSIPRVITGQGRWGVWRDEARWIGRWATGKEQNFFFFNVLTSFLGTHTEWLDVLGPPQYRRQNRRLRHANEEGALTQRTVILSNDKMTARRLIFLLSAFLPASQLPNEDASFARRPTTSNSLRAYSQSPPTGQQTREEPLRRAVGRRGSSRSYSRGHLRTMSFPTHEAVEEVPLQEEGLKIENDLSQRRSSDEQSTKTIGLPIHRSSNGEATRKSSVATTTTATPIAPIAHIMGPRHDVVEQLSMEHRRRGSSSSLASMNLMQTLRRNDSNNVSNVSSDSQPASRWGSLISGFWSGRRDSSTDNSEVIVGIDEHGPPPMHHSKGEFTADSKFPSARSDNSPMTNSNRESFETSSTSPTRRAQEDAGTLSSAGEEAAGDAVGSQAIPSGRPKLASESPLKLSVDEKDGIIDVDIGLPLFSSSFGSPLSSPSIRGGFLDSNGGRRSSLGGSQHNSACPFSQCEAANGEISHVAGWLKRFHADFALQAVAPYDELEEEVKRAMRMEPTPTFLTPDLDDDGWVEVCSTLIANAQTFTVKRLVLRRRLRGRGSQDEVTTSIPTSEDFEEQLTSEAMFNIDDTLVDAIERVVALSGVTTPTRGAATNANGPVSTAWSRSTSQRRGRAGFVPDSSDGQQYGEVPRGQCKKMIVGALDEVVRSVMAEVLDEDEEDEEGHQQQREKESTLREGIRGWLVAGMAMRRVEE